MKHYIITNRQVKKDRKGVEYITKDGYDLPSTNLRFATIDLKKNISILPDISLDIDGRIDYTHSSTFKKGSREMFDWLVQFLKNKKNEVVIFIPGYGNDTRDIKKFTKKIHKYYIEKQEENRKLVTFFWTTNGRKVSPKNYKSDAQDAIVAGMALANFLKKWNDYQKQLGIKELKGKIHLMAQSMGNQVLKYAIQNIEMIAEQNVNLNFSEVLLLAADVEKQVFREGSALEIFPDYCERIHVYGQKKDFALKMSNRMWREMDDRYVHRLGQGYSKREIEPNIDNLYSVDVSMMTKKDFRPSLDELIEHWYFVKSPRVVADINRVLDGKNSRHYK